MGTGLPSSFRPIDEAPSSTEASVLPSSFAPDVASPADAQGVADLVQASSPSNNQSVGEPAKIEPVKETRSVFNPARGRDELKAAAESLIEHVPELAGQAADYGTHVGENAVDLVKRSPVINPGPIVQRFMDRKKTGQTAFGDNSYLVPPEDVAALRAFMNNASFGALAARVEGTGPDEVPPGTYRAAEESQPAAAVLGGFAAPVPFGKVPGVKGALSRSAAIATMQTGVRGLSGQEVTPSEAFGAAGVNLALETLTHNTIKYGGKAVQAIHSLDPAATTALREHVFNSVREGEIDAAELSGQQGVIKQGPAQVGPRPKQDPFAAGLSTTPQGELKLREVWFTYRDGKLSTEYRDTVNPSLEDVSKARAAVGGELKTSLDALEHPVTQNAIIPYANRGAPRGGDAAIGMPVGEVRQELESMKRAGKLTGPNTVVPYAEPGGVSDAALAGEETLRRERANVVALDSDGHVRLLPTEAEPDPRPLDTRAIQNGDVVKLKHAGGEIPGVRVVGFGARENVSRKLGSGVSLLSPREEMNPNLVRVLLPGAQKATVWPLEALHLDTPQEAAHFESFRAEPGQVEPSDSKSVLDEIRRMGYVSPDRLIARYGFSPEESALALEAFRASGDLTLGERSGVYYPTSPIEPKPGASPGFAVAYGREGGVGRFDGADPTKPGNYRIEVEPGKYVSLPPSEFNTLRPITLANKDLAQVPAELGITVPMQPGMVAPTMQTASEINAAVALAKKLRLSEAGTKSRLQDAVTTMVRNELHRSPPLPWTGAASQDKFTAPPLWEAKAKLGASAKYYDPVVQTTIKALDAIGLGKPSDYDFAAILPVKKGAASDAALQAWAQKHPARAKSVYDTGKNMLAERDALEEKISGLDPTGTIASKQAQRSMNEAGEYVRGIFNATIGNGKTWADYVQKQQPHIWQAAVELFDSELAASGFKGSRGPAIEGIMDDLLKYGQEGLAGKMRARGTPAKVAKTFEQRIVLAPQVKALLGANQSGVIQMAHTLATLRVQASQLEAWSLIADSPYWSRPIAGRELPPRYDLTVRVPDAPQYGRAAGGWMHPRLAYLLDMPKSAETGFSIANALGRAWKKNVTVFGGPSVWINNAMRNIPDSIAAGGFDPARADKFMADMREAARVMHEYRKDPTHIGRGGLTAEAMDFNALSPGLMAAEGTRQREFLQRKILESVRNSKATTVPDLLADGVEKLKEGVDSVKDAYDFVDQWFKMANYIAIKRQAMAAGKSLNDAAAFASYKVNQNFPNFSQPSPFASAVAGKYGWAAPFATSGLEAMRIKGTYFARLAKGDTQLMASMAKGAVMASAIVGSMNALRRSNGISDDDVKHAKNQLPVSTRGYDPVLMPMPTLDAQGRVLFVNLSRYNDLSMVAAGSAYDPLWQRLTLGLMNDTVSGGAFMPPVNLAAAAGGLAPETARQNLDQMGRGMPLRGDEGMKTLMATAMVGAMLPQFPVRVAKTLKEGQPQNGQEPQLTQNEVIAKLLGLSLATTGPQAERTRALQAKKMIKDLRGDMVKGALQNKDDPEKQKELLDTQRAMLKQRIDTVFGTGGEQ